MILLLTAGESIGPNGELKNALQGLHINILPIETS